MNERIINGYIGLQKINDKLLNVLFNKLPFGKIQSMQLRRRISTFGI